MVVAWSTRYMRGFSFRIAVTSSGGILYPATRRSRSPSQRNSEPNFASQTWTALASIAWKTGSSSVGELLMTCSTSDVARCCSRASASSRVRASSCFFNSISELGPLLTRALAFVPVERSLRPRVGLFAPLRDKVTRTVTGSPSGRPSQGSGLPILAAPHDELAALHLLRSLLGFETQQGSCRLELFPLRWDNRVPHICEERHSSDAGNRLSHQLEPFCDQFGGQGAQAGDISARACKSGDDTGLDRFAARGHDHGNRPGGILGRHHRLRPAGHDQIDI